MLQLSVIFNRKCGCFHPSLPVTKHLQSKYNVSGCIRLMYEDMSRHLSEVNISDIDIESSMKNIDCYLFAGEDKEQKQQIEENCLFRYSIIKFLNFLYC